MKGISKFDFSSFYGGFDIFAVSKQKYTKDEAIAVVKRELEPNGLLAMGSAFVRHRAGRDECNERFVGWWLEYEEHENSCPVWCFHYARDPSHYGHFLKDYEIIKVGD